MGISEKDAAKLLDGVYANDTDERSTSEQVKETPRKLLSGNVEMNRRMDEDVKNLFPAPNDAPVDTALKSIFFTPQQAALGLADFGENAADAALGAGQQLARVPVQNRVTVGDLGRMIPGQQNSVTAAELLRSPQYQQALAQNPGLGLQGGAAQLVGSFAAPMGAIGAAGQALSRLGNAGARAVTALPRVGPALGAVGAALPAVGRAAANVLPRWVPPVARGAVQGGLWSLGMGAGNQFGYNKTLPTPQQGAGLIAGGAALGAPLAGAAHGLGALLRARAAIAALQRTAATQQVPPSVGTMMSQDIKSPAALFDTFKAAINKLEASGMPQEEIARRQEALIRSGERIGKSQEAPEYTEKMAKLRSHIADMRLFEARQAEKRVYAEQKTGQQQQFRSQQGEQAREHQESLLRQRLEASRQAAEGRQTHASEMADRRTSEKQGELATKEQKTGQHSEESGTFYRLLHDEIQNAQDVLHLRDLEKEIHDAGQGPTGKPLINSNQRSNLMNNYYRKMRELGSKPGESEVTGASKPEAGQAAEATEIESAPPHKPEEPLRGKAINNEEPTQPAGKVVEAANFIASTFRKGLTGELRKPENRYKLAVSVETLGKVAGLDQREVSALKQWTAKLSEAHLELKVKKMELDRLGEWFVKNESKLLPKEGDFEKVYDNDGIILKNWGSLKQLHFEVQTEKVLAQKYERQIEYKKSQLQLEGQQRGDLTDADLVVDPNPTIETTLNGHVQDWEEKANGGLEVQGMKPVTPPSTFREPKTLQEAWQHAERLKKWVKHFEDQKREIRAAEGEYDLLGYNDQGEKITPAAIMEKAFNNRKALWETGKNAQKVPTVHVWHVDEFGHVSTTVFKQPRQILKWNDATRDLEAKLNGFANMVREEHEREGKDIYKINWLRTKLNPALRTYGFTGLEAVPILAAWSAKALHGLAKEGAIGLNLQALTVGTVDNIIRNKSEFGGDKISVALHDMLGRTLDAFARDNGNMLARIQGAEDLTDLLNQFKGVKPNVLSYRRAALESLRDATKGTGLHDPAQVENAIKRAQTALMIRGRYRDLAATIKSGTKWTIGLDELEARQRDLKRGYVEKSRMKAYRPDQFDQQTGKLYDTVYDRGFYEALQELHDSLVLREEKKDGVSQLLGRMVSRKNASLFGNNPRTGFSNFFDAGIPTLLEFHKHWFKAASMLMVNPELRQAVERLPILPQADMEYIALQEALRNRPATKNLFKQTFYKVEDFQHWLGTAADPIFHGKERLVSLADRIYSKVGAVASISKQASMYGMKPERLVHDLLTGNDLSADQRATIWRHVSEDLSQIYNSVAPHLNRDLLAKSPLGKMVANYSAPKRRNFRLYWDWARSDNVADKAKFVLAMNAQMLLGGRAMVPQSVRAGLGIAAAVSGIAGANQWLEQELQDADKLNMMQKLAGVDLSDRIDFDVMNLSGAVMEGLRDYQQKAQAISAKEAGLSKAVKLGWLTLQSTVPIFPRISAFGADVWASGEKQLEYAAKNEKTYYVPVGTQLIPVHVPGFNTIDALREWMLPAPKIQFIDQRQRIRMSAAQHADLKAEQAQQRFLIPESTGDSGRSLIPTTRREF